MMTTMVRDGKTDAIRSYTTGGSDFVLAKCTRIMRADGSIEALDQTERDSIAQEVIRSMAQKSLRTLALAYRDFGSSSELPEGYEETAPESELTLYGVVGIKDPLRPEVPGAVAQCRDAGVMVRMVTGDNIDTAKAIARECGILTNGIAMEGPDFRKLTPAQLDDILPRLQVLARSSPRDKFTLVSRLNGRLPENQEEWEAQHPDEDYDAQKDVLLPGYKEEWATRNILEGHKARSAEVVGVTGDGTNDAPALKVADVGLAMGLSGTDVAKQAADIVILDDNFASIVKAVLWGRSVYDNIRKFLQFQLTVNVVALAVTFFAAVVSGDPPLNAIMMLWVNLIMDTLGALALGTEAPRPELLDRRPYRRDASLLSRKMMRNIGLHSIFQFAICLWWVIDGEDFFDITPANLLDWDKISLEDALDADKLDEKILEYRSTLIFNFFVFAQIFNEFNARSISDRWNVYEGLHTNWLFMGIIIASAGMQAFMVELGGSFTKTTGLTGEHWGITVGIAALALPLGIIMRFIPVEEDQRDFADPLAAASAAANAAASKSDVTVAVDGGGSSGGKTAGAAASAGKPGEEGDATWM
jgi:magnesium-transporting ATPase (P-type)